MLSLTKRQKEIINISLELIAEGGVQMLTIRNLSKRIGISEAALYRHFESKLDILLNILYFFREQGRRLLEKIESEGVTSIRKIKKIYRIHFQLFSENPSLASVVFSEEMFRNEQGLSDIVNSIMEMSNDVFTKCIEDGQVLGEIRGDIPAEQLAIMVIGSLRFIVTRWRLKDFSFNLIEEGERLTESMAAVLRSV